mgnify:CR=1 FL=1|tara:strand:- start:5315 stop:5536 length:222 start_codon:yes stop_codon:yes gene_type:complete
MPATDFQSVLNFARITKNLLSIESEINGLAEGFASSTERTALDEAFIDQLIDKAAALQLAASDLKDIAYSPAD